jgi:hypothetical protein
VCRFHVGLSEYREDELLGYLLSMSMPPKGFGSSGQKTLCTGAPKPCRQDGGSKNCSSTTVSALVYMGPKEGADNAHHVRLDTQVPLKTDPTIPSALFSA